MTKIRPINDTTYEVEMPSGDRVEIGDREAVDFKPHLKLNRWGGECFIKVALPTTEKVTPIVEAGKVKWQGQKLEAHFYSLEPTAMNELGGFEFEIVLKEKPVTNQIVLDFQAKGLRFSYQPPLTQQEIDRGDIRPDNVVGSYAVYHATKKNNQYMAGKAFHIYRPQAEDALGNKAWCSIHIDKYIDPTSLTLTIPQDFLDKAVYPVTIDPDFGESGVGGTWYPIASMGALFNSETRYGLAKAMPAPGGTANWIKAYVRNGTDDYPCDCKVFINQKDSGGAGTHGQIATKENLAVDGLPAHWEQFSLADEVLTAAVVYILSIIGNIDLTGQFEVAGDMNGAVASYEEYWSGGGEYPAPESPWVVDPEGTTIDYSIYCNYSLPAVGLENKSAGMAAKMVAAGLI